MQVAHALARAPGGRAERLELDIGGAPLIIRENAVERAQVGLAFVALTTSLKPAHSGFQIGAQRGERVIDLLLQVGNGKRLPGIGRERVEALFRVGEATGSPRTRTTGRSTRFSVVVTVRSASSSRWPMRACDRRDLTLVPLPCPGEVQSSERLLQLGRTRLGPRGPARRRQRGNGPGISTDRAQGLRDSGRLVAFLAEFAASPASRGPRRLGSRAGCTAARHPGPMRAWPPRPPRRASRRPADPRPRDWRTLRNRTLRRSRGGRFRSRAHRDRGRPIRSSACPNCS